VSTFAHIVNPAFVPDSADLLRAQPITFATMRQARLLAEPSVMVEQFTASYPTDQPVIPADFTPTPWLERSVLDVRPFHQTRKLPLLADILQRLYQASAAEYLIYTNVDIALQPDFYLRVNEFMQAGNDACVINRRTISDRYQVPAEIPLMLQEKGRPHKGWDCFVFKREHFPAYFLGDICVGAPRMGLALLSNLVAFATNFRELAQEKLTFHLGDRRAWQNKAWAEFAAHNTAELLAILSFLEDSRGPFAKNSIPGSYLWRHHTFGPLYDAWANRAFLPAEFAGFLNQILRRGN